MIPFGSIKTPLPESGCINPALCDVQMMLTTAARARSFIVSHSGMMVGVEVATMGLSTGGRGVCFVSFVMGAGGVVDAVDILGGVSGFVLVAATVRISDVVATGSVEMTGGGLAVAGEKIDISATIRPIVASLIALAICIKKSPMRIVYSPLIATERRFCYSSLTSRD